MGIPAKGARTRKVLAKTIPGRFGSSTAHVDQIYHQHQALPRVSRQRKAQGRLPSSCRLEVCSMPCSLMWTMRAIL